MYSGIERHMRVSLTGAPPIKEKLPLGHWVSRLRSLVVFLSRNEFTDDIDELIGGARENALHLYSHRETHESGRWGLVVLVTCGICSDFKAHRLEEVLVAIVCRISQEEVLSHLLAREINWNLLAIRSDLDPIRW